MYKLKVYLIMFSLIDSYIKIYRFKVILKHRNGKIDKQVAYG